MAHNFILPEILAAAVEERLGDAVKLYPLARVENLNGKAGETITIPTLNYIGDAEDVAAGVNIPLSDFVQSSADYKIKKVGKAMKFTQEDINNHNMDLPAVAEKQMLKAIANKIEKDMYVELGKATLSATVDVLDVAGLGESIVPFGEDIEEAMYLLINPKDLAQLRKDPNFIVNASHSEGAVKSAGSIFGMEVVVTNHVEENEAFIMKEEALALYLRKEVEVEMDKNILDQTHVVAATMHYAVALVDPTKVVKVTVGA